MTRSEIEAHWPLVVRHRAAIVAHLDAATTQAAASRRKVPRRVVIDGYDAGHEIPQLAAMLDLSISGVTWILSKAVRAAKAAEAGRLRRPIPRRKLALTLVDVPVRWIADVDAWAQTRGLSRREAVIELVKMGLDATAERHVLKQRRSVFGTAPR